MSVGGSLLLLAALPLFATGCGGDGGTGGGLFGNSSQSGVTQPSPSPTSPTTGTASTGLTPNAAPASARTGAALPPPVEAPMPPESLAPLSGTYAGTWAVAPGKADAGKGNESQDAAPARNAPPGGGTVTLKISYPKHPSRTVLGDVSGTWIEPSLGGVGRISGTVDRIGLPNEPNAVHVVGKITFSGGKSRPLAVELAEETVGHLGGSDADDTISLKKTR